MNKLWLLFFLYFINCYAPGGTIGYCHTNNKKIYLAQTIGFKFEFLNLTNTSEYRYKINHPEIFCNGTKHKIKIIMENDHNIDSSRLSVLRKSITLNKDCPYVLISLYEQENKEKKIYYASFPNEENLKTKKKLIEEVNQSYNKLNHHSLIERTLNE